MKRFFVLCVVFAVLTLLCGNVCADSYELACPEIASYLDAYSVAKNTSFTSVSDDISAYSYILHHREEIVVENGIIVLKASPKLTDNELTVLNQFVERLNALVKLNTVFIDEKLSIQVANSSNNDKSIMPIYATIDFVTIMRENVRYLKTISQNEIFGYPQGVVTFINKVRDGGDWDYKSHMSSAVRYYDPQIGYMTPENMGNYNYGCTGSVFFSPQTLKVAAGFVQICTDYSVQYDHNSYFDEPSDQLDIQRGIDFYNSGWINV